MNVSQLMDFLINTDIDPSLQVVTTMQTVNEWAAECTSIKVLTLVDGRQVLAFDTDKHANNYETL